MKNKILLLSAVGKTSEVYGDLKQEDFFFMYMPAGAHT